MSVDQALEAEAQAQAICMQTEDFKRAFEAFAARGKPDVRRPMKPEARYLDELVALPFFDAAHRSLAARVKAWCAASLESCSARRCTGGGRRPMPGPGREIGRGRPDAATACGRNSGARLPDFDARAICLIRETLAYHDGLADFAFAMQGLGSGAISLAGSASLQARYLPLIARGEAIAAFALSEPQAGSDVAAMTCRAERQGDHYVIEGVKTWISNGGIADFYCVFARTAAGQARADGTTGPQGISAFVVEASDPGLVIERRIEVNAPHPLAELAFKRCRIPANRLIGAEGEGFKIAMRTLDVFRTSVAAAATGFARRALDEALTHARQRRMFGKVLADFQLTQAALADMATAIDAAALLTYRAAWLRDSGQPVTLAAAMAKMTATESAQAVIDRALQMFGGRGVERGETVERLYREIRSLRIYEGATEVQKLIIGREVLALKHTDTATGGMGAAQGLFERHRGARNPGVHRRADRLGCRQKFAHARARAAGARRACQRDAGVGGGRRAAGAHRAADLVSSPAAATISMSCRQIGAAYRAVMGRHFPAMSVVEVSALMEADAKVEIEATAVLPDG